MTTTKKRAFIINCAFIACLVAIAYIAFNYLIIWLLPFLIGLLIAVILQRPINWLSKKTHLKKRFISPFITFILVVGVFGRIFGSLRTFAARGQAHSCQCDQKHHG